MSRATALSLVLTLGMALAGGCAGGASDRKEPPSPAKVDVLAAAAGRWLADLKDDRPQVRARAAGMAGFLLRDGRAVEPLAAAMGDNDRRVREAAKYALEHIYDPHAGHAFVLALGHSDPAVRAVAADRLTWIAGNTDLRDDFAVLATAACDPDPKVRCKAIFLLHDSRDPRAVDLLVAAMKSDDPETRREAAWSLAWFGDVRARDSLVAALKDKDPDVRAEAVAGLAEIGGDHAVELLLAAFADESGQVRWRAASALEEVGNSRAIPVLTAALKDPKDSVRSHAARALGNLTDPLGPVVRPPRGAPAKKVRGAAVIRREALRVPPDLDARITEGLAALMADTSSDVYGAAADALVRRLDARCVPAVIAALKDGKTVYARQAAARVLGKIKDPRAIKPLVACLADSEWIVRDAARDALRTYKGEALTAALLAAPRSDRPEGRSRLVEMLAESGAAGGVDAVLVALKDPNPGVRCEAARTAGAFKDPRTLEPLIAATRDGEPSVRAAAAAALLGAPGDRAAAAVAAVMRDDSNEARLRLAGKIGPGANEALPLLADALHDKDEKVRLAAMSSLGALRSERAWDLLHGAWKDEVPHLRPSALQAMCLAKDARTLDVLAEAVNDADPKVAVVAAYALKDLGDPRAVPWLERALASQDFDTHGAALLALDKLGRPPKDEGDRAWLLFARGEWSEAKEMVPANLRAVISALHGAPSAEWIVDDNFNRYFSMYLVCDAQGGEALRAGLADPNWCIRETFVAALGRSKDPAAVPLLLESLKDERPEVRGTAAGALGSIGLPGAVPALAGALYDENEQVRASAVAALGWIRDERVFPLVAGALKQGDAYVYVRQVAAATLGELGDARAVEPLRDALKDYHAEVVRAARKALDKLGQPVPDEPVGSPRH
ncbi:MAG: HEAT repeat domain-containing protein [Planctomycetota bacterium]|nr:HEAT repeat domain-containing protein [Planctomycetota bacterium]